MATDRRRLFASLLSQTPASSDSVDSALLRRCERRLDELEARAPLGGLDLKNLLAVNGVSRRAFLGWTSATTALLMLHPWFEPLVARAAEVMNRVPVIWLEGQDWACHSICVSPGWSIIGPPLGRTEGVFCDQDHAAAG